MIGKNWDKPFTEEEFKEVWMADSVEGKGTFHEYHELNLNWGDTHELIGEKRETSVPKTAYPKYVQFCMLGQSPLMKVLK